MVYLVGAQAPSSFTTRTVVAATEVSTGRGGSTKEKRRGRAGGRGYKRYRARGEGEVRPDYSSQNPNNRISPALTLAVPTLA